MENGEHWSLVWRGKNTKPDVVSGKSEMGPILA